MYACVKVILVSLLDVLYCGGIYSATLMESDVMNWYGGK